jgi:leucine-rich repeat protein SHOC2
MLPEDEGKVEKHKMGGVKGKDKKAAQAPTSDTKKKISKCKDEKSIILDLSKSDIGTIPSNIKDVSFIEELYLYGNRITAIPPEIGNLKKLRKLALNENLLTELPIELRQCVSLQVLDLRHNRLKEIPPVVCELSSLQTLYLRFNKLITVTPAIANLRVSRIIAV